MVILLLFVTFPQLLLWEPKDCIFVVTSMMDIVDASLRRGCGFVIIQWGKRVYEFPSARRRGELSYFFGKRYPIILHQGNPSRKEAARGGQTRRHHKLESNTVSRASVIIASIKYNIR